MYSRTPFFLRFTIALLIGIQSGFEASPWLGLILLLPALLQTRLLIYAAAFIAGYALASAQKFIPAEAEYFQVKILDRRSPGFAFADVQGYLSDSLWHTHAERVRIFIRKDTLPAHGILLCRASLNKSQDALNIANFEIVSQDTSWVEGWRIKVRQRLSTRIHPEVLGIAKGIVLGDKSGIKSEVYDLYKYAGGAHILAVSGLHTGIVYGVILLLLYPLGNRPVPRWIKMCLTLLMLWAYALITGFSPSVVRACGFFTFFTLARNRNRNMYHTLSLMLFLALIWDPRNLFSIGLQLSYLAVFGILLFQPIFEQALHGMVNPYKWILRSVTVSLSAQLPTYPVVAYYFGVISLAGIFTSLVLIPFAFLVIVLVVFLLVCPNTMLSPGNVVLTWITRLVHHTLEGINAWPFAYIHWEIQSMIPYFLILILGYVSLKWPGKQTWLMFLLGLIFCLTRH